MPAWREDEEQLQSLIPKEAMSLFKEFSDVEHAFRYLKEVIEMHLIYHRTNDLMERQLGGASHRLKH
jgi:hypothetical protein